eukprot:469220_1
MVHTVLSCIVSIATISNVYGATTSPPTYAPIQAGHWSTWVEGTPSLITGTTLLETYDMSHITEFCVYTGLVVNAIKVRFRNGEWSEKVGAPSDSDGSKFCESIPDDLCWDRVWPSRQNCFNCDDNIGAIQFCRYDADARNSRICTEKYGGGGTAKRIEQYPTGECVKALNVSYSANHIVGIQAYFEALTPQRPTSSPTLRPSNNPVSGPTASPTYNPIAVGYWSRNVAVDTINLVLTRYNLYPTVDSFYVHHHHITEVCVKYGTLVNSIKVRFRNGEWSDQGGRDSDATEACHALPSIDDCYDAIAIWKDESFNAIQFRIKSNQSWTPKFGGTGGTATPLNNIIAENDGYNEDECIHALLVKTDDTVRSLGAYFQGYTPLTTLAPTASPSQPSANPSSTPTVSSAEPTGSPTTLPSASPSSPPTVSSAEPTSSPTTLPSASPSSPPTQITDAPTAQTPAPTVSSQPPSPGITDVMGTTDVDIGSISKSPFQRPLYIFTAILFVWTI